MSNWKSKLNFVFYLITLAVAIILIYQVFTTGFKKGQFTGKYYPPEEKKLVAEAEKKPVNLRMLRIPTPELVATGAKLYKLNCASCHGAGGTGDGPKAVSLNPPPRNFTAEKFKYGASVLQIYHTLTNGIQGTSMPAFDLLPEEDRMCMAHYVRTFVPDPPDDPPELVDALPVIEEGTGAVVPAEGMPEDSTAKVKTPSIPIDLAMEQVLKETVTEPKTSSKITSIRLFERQCASCHGSAGEGMVQAEQVVPASVIYLERARLAGKKSRIMLNEKAFEDFITLGSPGIDGHNFGFLTQREIDELFDYVRKLSEASE
jgi:mono/diheme cytochrome c family protein